MSYSTNYIHINSLSFRSIYLVLKKRGLKGLFYHLSNVYFDFIHNTNTSNRIIGYGKPELISTYATTPQKIIRDSLIRGFNLLNIDSNSVDFFEMGAGKGKVVVIIKNIIKKLKVDSINLKAIEIDSSICDIFRRNLENTGYSIVSDENLNTRFYFNDTKSKKNINVELICEDLNVYAKSLIDLSSDNPKIIYCCNLIPVDKLIKFIRGSINNRKSQNLSNLLIYANPVHIEELMDNYSSYFDLVFFKKGFPQESYAILRF